AVEATPVASPGSAASPVATPATPVTTEVGDGTGARLLSPPSTLTWSPSGDHLVATVAGNAVVILTVADTTLTSMDVLAIPDAAGTVVGAWMSPRQDRVLLVLDAGSGGNAIATISLTGNDRRPHVVWPGTDERRTKSVRQVAWMPDGTGLVFTAVQKGTTGSGNLYEVPLSTLEPRVLATPGRAGPSARVGTFAISPDGKSIAYTLETPNGSDWTFHSLWVRSVRGGSALEVSSANGSTVSTPVWTSEGLVWEQSPADGAQADLVVAREDGSSAVIASRDESGWHRAGAQGATPVASPGASPVASPIASPSAVGATPLATPGASPNG
ncbi:MAG: hypothetical protein WBA46_09440, partial [Thermomicrobiales bacterium]